MLGSGAFLAGGAQICPGGVPGGRPRRRPDPRLGIPGYQRSGLLHRKSRPGRLADSPRARARAQPKPPSGRFLRTSSAAAARRRGCAPASPASFAAPFTGRKPAKLPSATLCKAQRPPRCPVLSARARPPGGMRAPFGAPPAGGLVSAAGLFLGGEGFVQPRHQNAGQYRGDQRSPAACREPLYHSEYTAEVMPNSLGHSASQIIHPVRKWHRKRSPSVTTTPPMMAGRLEPNIEESPITVWQ